VECRPSPLLRQDGNAKKLAKIPRKPLSSASQRMLVPSGRIAGSIEPFAAGVEPWLDPG
jgi:hypothetical protein